MKNTLAICIFAYNRPLELSRTLTHLKHCEELDCFDVHVFSDGAKLDPSEGIIQVTKVRNIIDSCGVKIHRRHYKSKNIGLRQSIISGINEVANSYDAFVVLEDDIVLSKNALVYARCMLEQFKNHRDIMHVNLWNHPSVNNKYPYYSSYMHCWGWASWSNYWLDVDFSKRKFSEIKLKDRFRISKGLSTLHLSHLYANYIGIRDTWAVFWLTHIIINRGKCISPSFALSKNIGLESGEHVESYSFEQKLKSIRPNDEFTVVRSSPLSELKIWYKYITGTRFLSTVNMIRIMLFK